MKPRELFGVLVRTIGVVLFLPAVFATSFALLGLVLGGPGEVIGMLWFGIPALVVGLWLLRGANALVAFAFPENESENKRFPIPRNRDDQ